MAKNGLATPVARMAIAKKAIRPVSADAIAIPVLAVTYLAHSVAPSRAKTAFD